jgi:hypothetical protein
MTIMVDDVVDHFVDNNIINNIIAIIMFVIVDHANNKNKRSTIMSVIANKVFLAQGIVTRMGRDRRASGRSLEPGPAPAGCAQKPGLRRLAILFSASMWR